MPSQTPYVPKWMGTEFRAEWWEQTGSTPAADGTQLFFACAGDKKATTLVCSNGVGVGTFFWNYIGKYFKEKYRVVVWDYRGHGLSGLPKDPSAPISMSDIAEDLARVMDAADVDQGVLLGHSMGCQAILEFAHLYKERALGLVPMLGTYGRAAETFLDPKVGPVLFRGAYKVGRKIPKLLRTVMKLGTRERFAWHFSRASGLVHPDLCRREDLKPYLKHMSEVHLGVFFEMARAAQEHDAGPYLEKLNLPTLVVAGECDLFTPTHLSQEMARKIPQADYLLIPRGSHAAIIEQPELINLRLEKFLTERVAPFSAALSQKLTESLA